MAMKAHGTTLPFEEFWAWLGSHADCTLRAGTDDAWLYDQDDLHWHVRQEDGQHWVQLMRGKHIVGEIGIDSTEIAAVQVSPVAETEGEFEYQLLSESGDDLRPIVVLILAHGYEETEGRPLTTH